MRNLRNMYGAKTITAPSGRIFNLSTGVSLNECEFIRSIIKSDTTIIRTLEIGCALGFSSVAICDGLDGRNGALHTIIDPFQIKGWERLGVRNIENHGLSNFKLIEEYSEFALPEITRNEAENFDLIFIDGMHTFDHTIIDLFYANRLLRSGGYIILDDTNWPAVAKAAAYFDKYPHYKVAAKVPRGKGLKAKVAAGIAQLGNLKGLGLSPVLASQKIYEFTFGTMVAWQKMGPDERTPDWFRPF